MCNGHHLYELIALLMLFVCLQKLLVVLSLQQNSYLKICPFCCALWLVIFIIEKRSWGEAETRCPKMQVHTSPVRPLSPCTVQPPQISWVAALQKYILLQSHWQNTLFVKAAASVSSLCLHRHCQWGEWSFLLKKNKLDFQFPVIRFWRLREILLNMFS